MKKLFVLALVVVMTFVMAVSAFAVMTGKTVEYDGKGAGKVVFEGKMHAGKDAGKDTLKCADCHPKLFQMKKGVNVMTKKDMEAGKYCGACHNGVRAFGVKDPATCVKCHKK